MFFRFGTGEHLFLFTELCLPSLACYFSISPVDDCLRHELEHIKLSVTKEGKAPPKPAEKLRKADIIAFSSVPVVFFSCLFVVSLLPRSLFDALTEIPHWGPIVADAQRVGNIHARTYVAFCTFFPMVGVVWFWYVFFAAHPNMGKGNPGDTKFYLGSAVCLPFLFLIVYHVYFQLSHADHFGHPKKHALFFGFPGFWVGVSFLGYFVWPPFWALIKKVIELIWILIGKILILLLH